MNEVHILNLHAKTQLLMYDKGGFTSKKFSPPEGGMEDNQEARTGVKHWIFEKSFI